MTAPADLTSGKGQFDGSALASGKGHADENFPVASWLVRPDARGPVMAYYDFARMADDIADHETAAADEKLRLLAAMRAGLEADAPAGAPKESVTLAQVARERGLDLVHARDLVTAFEQDCVQNRYADWDGLVRYCRYSAMPVGRFVLDVHGEDRALWPMNDALCAALQIINHLQDCGKDYRALDRVYLPHDTLAAHGVDVAALGGPASPPGLRAAIRELAERTLAMLGETALFAPGIRDFRLSAEVAVIQRLAVDLAQGLTRRDPLADRVHHGKARAGMLALAALVRHGISRIVR